MRHNEQALVNLQDVKLSGSQLVLILEISCMAKPAMCRTRQEAAVDNSLIIKKALEVIPYENLYELANSVSEEAMSQQAQKTVEKPVPKKTENTSHPKEDILSKNANLLACHVVSSPDITYKRRGELLKLSMRKLGPAKEELVSKEMVMELEIGRGLFLAPTEKLYQYLGLICPYKRNVSIEHSFMTLLAQLCTEADPLVQKSRIEMPVGNIGHTIDMVSNLTNGQRIAWEITCNCKSNVASHAAKLKDKGFSKIVFVCRDHNIRKSVQTILADAGFEPEFYSIIECVLLGDLINKKKKFNK